jgi:cystathionine gamma-synthase
VAAVYYPGLETHPHHDIAARQMRGYGGVLSFMLEGGFEAVKRVLPRLKLAHLAANLGAVETIAGPPATTSHVECTAAERAAMGIPEGLVRYSVGIEDAGDLMRDLEQALALA